MKESAKVSGAIGRIRDDFPMLAHYTHFNCGGMAPLSTSVGAELLRAPTAIIEQGPARLLARDDDFIGIEKARAKLATFIGADPDEIAFTTQFSTAVNIVVEGLAWQPGDEVIVTDQEHPALLIPLMNVVRRHGLKVSRIPVSHNADEMLTHFQALLTDRTKLVAVSHVTTDSGTRLPAEEMTRLAHAVGSYVFFDGAHSAGQFPLDLHALGCDFYAMVGYKWLFGPYPSAALYLRRELLDQIEVTWCGSNVTQSGSVTMGVEDLNWIPGARRFEYGGRTYSYDTAMVAGLSYVDRLGVEAVEAHSRHLTAYFHDALQRVPGARIHSPLNLRDATGIATVSLDKMDGVALSAALRERWQMIQRPALRGTTVRISLAAFIEESDVDLLVDSLRTLATE
ncbi:MAG: aminotransferase class V-fold PLP-dependent enzyme [Caldilineaceae bacterium]|nr:aminotransferase class V-fold PLP-dependent enzyme [Caldilineaceae bacterium]